MLQAKFRAAETNVGNCLKVGRKQYLRAGKYIIFPSHTTKKFVVLSYSYNNSTLNMMKRHVSVYYEAILRHLSNIIKRYDDCCICSRNCKHVIII
jgi:hypothetical protein